MAFIVIPFCMGPGLDQDPPNGDLYLFSWFRHMVFMGRSNSIQVIHKHNSQGQRGSTVDNPQTLHTANTHCEVILSIILRPKP